ncbi:MAG: DUF721 domain-containing protein [Nitriliruptorales bacterium]
MEHEADVDWVLDEGDALRPTRAPSQVGHVLQGLVERRGWTERLRGAVLFSHWRELVGPELSRRCQPVRLVGGLLVIRAESTVWAAEVAYLVDEIASRAADLMGPGLVRDIRVVVGPSTATTPGAGPSP